ncbi:molybdate ABC transporter substrate-binding protein [Ornithinimicrobium sp. Arc0846-15]|nr:molybdate ABC transporter substrate-binding protein [Ornithinimicrobium laminariae]
MIRRYAVVLAASAALAVSACSASTSAQGDEPIAVLAAASLTTVLPDIEKAWGAEGTGYDLVISFAGSSTIVQQINEGAPADVILLAGEESLAGLVDGPTVGDPTIFTTNSLALAVPASNPAGITSIDDLNPADSAGEGPTLVVCAEQVPCGSASAQMFEQAGFAPEIASFEPDVRSALAKTISGEADAAIVYRTDVTAASDDVRAIDLPDEVNVTNRYPALSVSDSETAMRFIDDLQGETAQNVLTDAGFGAP